MRFATQWKESNVRVAFIPILVRCLLLLVSVPGLCAISFAAEAPKLVEKEGRWAFLVDGQPYLILGGQVHNSSAWPSELPQVWKSAANLHANTIAAPIYWEQFEPQPGKFDYSNVDALLRGAREHHLQ